VSAAAAAASTADAPPADETFTYQAEVDRLMDMIVNSLYSNTDVFLRELVSNASDALDKARFNAITAGGDAGALRIRVKGDPDAGTVTIEDTGCGMSRDDLVSSLGTIARSGTAKFAAAVKESGGDAALIGQFGVGFYSAFLVADRVTVTTRADGEGGPGWQWESAAGSHSYSVKAAPPDFDLPRGTRVTLHLKPDATDLADGAKLGELLARYSEFVAFPVELWASKTEYDQVPDDAATARAQEAADAKAREEGKDKADPVAPVTVPKPRDAYDWRVQNAVAPIWTRPPKDVTPAEHAAFFKQTFKEFADPAATAHFSVEGTVEFTALLYVPGMPPFDAADWMKPARNVRLFVKRVFISDEFDEDLVPRWASFVRGVVDSADLPLNVSREILQESRVVRTIRRQLTKRTLDLLTEIAGRDKEEGKALSDYDVFWDGFGKYIKLGAIEDAASRDALAGLLRFPSSATAKEGGDGGGPGLTGLKAYKDRMKEGQTEIFYIAADSAAAAAAAPHVEGFARKGYEVLYLTEPIDEPALNAVGEFEGLKFVDVTREGVDAGADEDEKAAAAATEELKPLLDYVKAALGDRVEKVEVSTRLADSPVALVTSKFGWSAHQERMMRAQALGDAKAAEYMRGRKTLEVNAGHPVIRALAASVAGGDTDKAAKAVELLFDAALVTGGFAVDSPREFAGRIYDMIESAVGGK
jgi:heat shock protein beta